MLVITGIFENERFIPDTPVVIPQKKKVVVTIEEDHKASLKAAADILYDDYKNDKTLTEFTQLDCENFYEAR
jgi:hypothetical protein